MESSGDEKPLIDVPKPKKQRKPCTEEQLKARRESLQRGRATIAKNREAKQKAQPAKGGSKYKVYEEDSSSSSESESDVDELIIAKRSKKTKVKSEKQKGGSAVGPAVPSEIALLREELNKMKMKLEKSKQKTHRNKTIINIPAQTVTAPKDNSYSEQYKTRILKL